jgi:hypothetical protein
MKLSVFLRAVIKKGEVVVNGETYTKENITEYTLRELQIVVDSLSDKQLQELSW